MMRHIHALLVMLCALATPSFAEQVPADPNVAMRAKLAEIEAALEQRRQEVVTLEATPAAEGSERAALAQAKALEARRAEQVSKLESLRQAETATNQAVSDKLAEVWPIWAAPAPTAAVAEEPALDLVSILPAAPAPVQVTASAEATGALMDWRAEFAALPADPTDLRGLPRRVLTLPAAELVQNPSDPASKTVPLATFSILYVFGEAEDAGQTWLAVGLDAHRADGWLRANLAEDWRTMLVMQYATKGDRQPVLFFKNAEAIHSILEDGIFGHDALNETYQEIAKGQYSGSDIIATEPRLAVKTDDRPYLMPILGFQKGFFADEAVDTQLLELAAVTLQPEGRDGAPIIRDTSVEVTSEEVKNFKVGVAFVIDTTTSMGPYIDRVKSFVTEVQAQAEAQSVGGKIDIAIVGFRGSTSEESRLEYETRIFRDFGAPLGAEDLKKQVTAIKPSKVPTANWREDAFAGLTDAIEKLDWGKVDSRIVFLVTDASPRTLGDLRARDPSLGPRSVGALAAQNNIAILTLHMQTEEARQISIKTDKEDDVERGKLIYPELRGAGVGGLGTYFQLAGNSAKDFEVGLNRLASQIVASLAQLSRGEVLADLGADANPVLDEEVKALKDGTGGIVIDSAEKAELISSAVLSEMFRYQQEYLGARNGVEAPAFYRAWAADRDLLSPTTRSLNVSVFMTRQQLGDLSAKLDDVVQQLEAKESGLGDFFAEVQQQASSAAVDPNLAQFLPSYLEELPYGSPFINLTAEGWQSLGQAGQLDLLSDVKEKIGIYRRVNSTEAGWFKLSDRDGAEQVYPLPLSQLP
jgi:serine/threonine-protein kinase PpkA